MTGVQTCALPICFPVTIAEERVEEREGEGEFISKYYNSGNNRGRNRNINYRNRRYENKPNEYSNDEFRDVIKKRRERVYYEIENKIPEERIIEEEMMNSYRLLVHHVNDKSWDYNSYHKIYEMRRWKDIGILFGSMRGCKEYKYNNYDLRSEERRVGKEC